MKNLNTNKCLSSFYIIWYGFNHKVHLRPVMTYKFDYMCLILNCIVRPAMTYKFDYICLISNCIVRPARR